MLCTLCDIYAVTNTDAYWLCISCVLHHTAPDSQTEACLAFGNPNSQRAASNIKIRRDGRGGTRGDGGEGEWKRERQQESERQWRTDEKWDYWSLRRLRAFTQSQELAEGMAHTHTLSQSPWVTFNKCHPHVRWPGRAGPAVCSLVCASSRNRCCFPAQRSRPRRPSECCWLPPGTGERTPDTPAHATQTVEVDLFRFACSFDCFFFCQKIIWLYNLTPMLLEGENFSPGTPLPGTFIFWITVLMKAGLDSIITCLLKRKKSEWKTILSETKSEGEQTQKC